MRGSAIRSLTSARHVPIIAAARFERNIQIWNWDTGELGCEFETVTDGHTHLSLSPSGDYLLAANWRKGERGGVGCYRTSTGEKLWHRQDIRRTGRIRFASDGASVWCGIDGSPLQQLNAQTGETLTAMRAVQEVLDSPFSNHRLVIGRKEILIKGGKGFAVPGLSFAVLDAAFGPNTLCLTEAGGVARCIDLDFGAERWRYTPPKGHHLIFLSYSNCDRCFYGAQWSYERGGPSLLMRISEGTGAFAEVCDLNAYPDCCCFGDGVVVTSSGDVVSLTSGKSLRKLAFPECDYPN
jgi:WD40 repeat protein